MLFWYLALWCLMLHVQVLLWNMCAPLTYVMLCGMRALTRIIACATQKKSCLSSFLGSPGGSSSVHPRLSRWMITPLACARWNNTSKRGIEGFLMWSLYFRCVRQHASTTASWSSFWKESANATQNCVRIGSAPVWQMTKPASWATASAHLATA